MARWHVDSLLALLSPLWGWIAAGVAVVVSLVVARRSGRTAQKQETDAKVAQQQGQAYQTVKEVRDELDKAGPDGSRERSRRWVRDKDAGGH